MALNPTPVGDAIAAYVKSIAPAPGTAIDDAFLKTMWEGIVTIIYNDLKTNLGVLPGTFLVDPSSIIAPAGGGPCTGTAPVTGIGGPAQ